MAEENAIAEDCFAQIRNFYPDLEMQGSCSGDGEPQLSIPRQPGLCFELELYLYGDVLNLCAESFWGEWFPCKKPSVCSNYVDAICGLIEGEFRIVEHRRGKQILRVILQGQNAGRWRSVSTCYRKIHFPFLKTEKRIFQNIAA